MQGDWNVIWLNMLDMFSETEPKSNKGDNTSDSRHDHAHYHGPIVPAKFFETAFL